MAENINALSAERNRLRVRVEELNKLFADAANERDQALSQLEQCRKQLAAASEMEALQSQLADIRQHSAQSDKELCQLQDALGCPCESRNYFCDCGWRGYNHHKCPKCGKETHDDGMADAQALCMERIRDFVMAEDENKTLRAQNRELNLKMQEASALIEKIGTTGVERTDIIRRAEEWLESLSQPEAGKV